MRLHPDPFYTGGFTIAFGFIFLAKAALIASSNTFFRPY